jgi:uncharacterized protein YbjT (DUF2867 family)
MSTAVPGAGVDAHPLRTVLVLGASGFIGRNVRYALKEAGFDVVRGVRSRPDAYDRDSIPVDYRRDHHIEDWLPRLRGIDAVVNAVGRLRESRDLSFEAVHVRAPTALFEACVQAGVAKIVQISALGADRAATSRYHLTKQRADDVLSALPIRWSIVQPSLVFGEGGTSAALFTMLAALPLIPVPGNGDQRVQPIHVDDLSAAVVKLLQTDAYDGMRIAAVGPRALTLSEFLVALRSAMGLGNGPLLRVSMRLVRAAATLGDRVPGLLLDRETLGMLVRGNTAPADGISSVLGRPPRGVECFVRNEHAASIANRARLAWLLPLLRLSIAAVWIVTGIVSLGVYPVDESYELLARVGLTGTVASIALYGAAGMDLLLGIAMLVMPRSRRLYKVQIAVILAYTAIITAWLPEFWLHPYGPVLKNLPLLAGILVLHELADT